MVVVGDYVEDLFCNSGVVYAVNGDWIHFTDAYGISRACTRGYVREVRKVD